MRRCRARRDVVATPVARAQRRLALPVPRRLPRHRHDAWCCSTTPPTRPATQPRRLRCAPVPGPAHRPPRPERADVLRDVGVPAVPPVREGARCSRSATSADPHVLPPPGAAASCPAYWVALIGSACIFGLQIVERQGWIGNVFLLPAFGVPVQVCNADGNCHVAYGITQAWSIGVEATFYLLLPLFAAAWPASPRPRATDRRRRVLVLLAGAGGRLPRRARPSGPTSSPPTRRGPSSRCSGCRCSSTCSPSAWRSPSSAPRSSVGQRSPACSRWFGDHPAALLGHRRRHLPRRHPDEVSRPSPSACTTSTAPATTSPASSLYGIGVGDLAGAGDLRRSDPRPAAGDAVVAAARVPRRDLAQLLPLAPRDHREGQGVDGARLRDAAGAGRAPPPGNTLDGVGTFTGNYLEVRRASPGCISFVVASVLFRVVELPFLRLKDEPCAAPIRSCRRGPQRLRPDARSSAGRTLVIIPAKDEEDAAAGRARATCGRRCRISMSS